MTEWYIMIHIQIETKYLLWKQRLYVNDLGLENMEKQVNLSGKWLQLLFGKTRYR